MLMILGSDDMVSEDYMKVQLIFIDKFDFCYNKSWLTYNSSDGYLFCQKYPGPPHPTSDKMLGAEGFSNKILKKLNYKIYDTVLNKDR